MSPAFLDIVAAFALFRRSAINLLIIVILLRNTVLPLFYRAHPYYHLLVLTSPLKPHYLPLSMSFPLNVFFSQCFPLSMSSPFNVPYSQCLPNVFPSMSSTLNVLPSHCCPFLISPPPQSPLLSMSSTLNVLPSQCPTLSVSSPLNIFPIQYDPLLISSFLDVFSFQYLLFSNSIQGI